MSIFQPFAGHVDLLDKTSLVIAGALCFGILALVASVVMNARALRRAREDLQERTARIAGLQGLTEQQLYTIKGHEITIASLQREVEAARADSPSGLIEAFERGRDGTDVARALHALTAAYRSMLPPFAHCCLALGRMEHGLYTTLDAPAHLARAEKLLRIVQLLQPSNADAGALLSEIGRRRSIGEAGDPGAADLNLDDGFVAAYLLTDADANADANANTDGASPARGKDGPPAAPGGRVAAEVDKINRRIAPLVQAGMTASCFAAARRAVDLSHHHLPPEHAATLNSEANLATALDLMGRHDEAVALLREVLRRQEADESADAEGADRRGADGGGADPEGATHTRYSLVFALGRQNRHDEAEAILRQMLARQSERLGAEHPQTLATTNNLAGTIFRQGRLAEAEALWWQVLHARERLLGVEHPETVRTRINLAVAFGHDGRHADALAMWGDVLVAQQRISGPEHPDTLQTRRVIGETMAAQGRGAEAEAYLRRLLVDFQRVLGAEHPETLKLARTIEGLQSAAVT
jgi:tetratricopeptide (TPR) repeat protein